MNADKTIDFKKIQEEFKKSLDGKTKEELEKIEQEVIKEAEEADKELSVAKIGLPKKNYEKVAEYIQYFLDKQSVQWQYAQAMSSMYNFWDPKVYNANIEYPMLHQTLTTLGGLQFTGHDEWEKVIIINSYFEPLHDSYVELSSKPYMIAAKHDMIMNKLGLSNPIQSSME